MCLLTFIFPYQLLLSVGVPFVCLLAYFYLSHIPQLAAGGVSMHVFNLSTQPSALPLWQEFCWLHQQIDTDKVTWPSDYSVYQSKNLRYVTSLCLHYSFTAVLILTVAPSNTSMGLILFLYDLSYHFKKPLKRFKYKLQYKRINTENCMCTIKTAFKRLNSQWNWCSSNDKNIFFELWPPSALYSYSM